jgi:acyl-CoA synthetase (AMP-forming)/AMP-acid ligase II
MAETVFAVSQSSREDPPRIERIDREAFQTESLAVPEKDGQSGTVEVMSGGTPIPGTEVRVIADDRSPLPERRVGEIAVRCDWLFDGYFRDPESTRQVLADGWYDTGDLGYLAEEHLFITGRKKDLIIVAGKNYYPQDIERIVSSVGGIHAGRVVALGLDDPGIGTQRLIVIAELEDAEAVDELEIAGRVRSELASELDCVIDDLRLVPHMWLLKTSSGKIARAPNLRRYLELLRPPENAEGNG